MNIDDFREIVSDELDLLPDYCFKDLTGGVVVSESAYLHPDRVADDLYIMGTYHTDSLRKQITIYYGSFVKTMPFMDENLDALREKIREVLRHEFLHHLENLAGIRGMKSLMGEDYRRMVEYYERHKKREDLK